MPTQRFARPHLATIATLIIAGCTSEVVPPSDGGADARSTLDAAMPDAGAVDASVGDTGPGDTGATDASSSGDDAGETDAGEADAGEADAGEADAGDSCPSAAERCDDAVHPLCAEVACADATYTCSFEAGAWGWHASSGPACDDTNPCTYGDACSAGACVGTTLSCDAMDTACRDYACDGDATCASSVRTGATCDDGDALTAGDTCDAAGVCSGTTVCALPATACADGAQNRIGCGGARVIGRRTAAAGSGALITADTCSAASAFNSSACAFDGGPDHAYRIWMRAGETLTVGFRRNSDCGTVDSPTWDATLELYESTGCEDVTCGAGLWCRHHVSNGSYPYTATHDGWIVIDVDGVAGVGDEGVYRIQVQLGGCAAAGCEC
jgi:hypothetical protein